MDTSPDVASPEYPVNEECGEHLVQVYTTDAGGAPSPMRTYVFYVR